MGRLSSHRSTPRRGRSARRWLVAPVFVLLAAIAVFVGNPLDAGAADITSAGPLDALTTTADLNCAVHHSGDSHGEFFGDTACGTFVTDGHHLFGPADVPAADFTSGAGVYEAWTPVSQTGPTGSGTASDPFTLVTTVKGGPFTVVQTDTYVTEQEYVSTDVKVTSSARVSATVYRAGDCYLQDSDVGLGRLDAGVAPTCVADPNSTNPNRIEQLYPTTPGSRYMVGWFSDLWDAVASMQPLPNTIVGDIGDLPTSYIGLRDGNAYDNAAGLSWTRTIAAGSSATFSSFMTFSPVGATPLTVTKTVTPGTVAPGGQVTYTITITNPGVLPETLTQITDMLPAGFGYVRGSTTGATHEDPSLDCLPLTWNGHFTVPAGHDGTPGRSTLTFTAQVPMTPGTYTNSADASGPGLHVIGAIHTAPVRVEGPAPTTTTATSTSTSTTSSTSTTTTTSPPSISSTSMAAAPRSSDSSTAPTTVGPGETTTTTVPAPTTTVSGAVVVPPAQCPSAPTPGRTPAGGARPATPVSASPNFTG